MKNARRVFGILAAVFSFAFFLCFASPASAACGYGTHDPNNSFNIGYVDKVPSWNIQGAAFQAFTPYYPPYMPSCTMSDGSLFHGGGNSEWAMVTAPQSQLTNGAWGFNFVQMGWGRQDYDGNNVPLQNNTQYFFAWQDSTTGVSKYYETDSIYGPGEGTWHSYQVANEGGYWTGRVDGVFIGNVCDYFPGLPTGLQYGTEVRFLEDNFAGWSYAQSQIRAVRYLDSAAGAWLSPGNSLNFVIGRWGAIDYAPWRAGQDYWWTWDVRH